MYKVIDICRMFLDMLDENKMSGMIGPYDAMSAKSEKINSMVDFVLKHIGHDKIN